MKEFIEIPFGAKDSELEGWEYTIPEGFVASIENGKIIVKKEDDRDEKIRKEILEYFQQFENKELRGVNISDWIIWLEKQGESSNEVHYWTEEEIEPIISDYLRGAEHYGGMISRLRCLKPKSLEKQGEQKSQRIISAEAKEAMYDNPAWNEDDEEFLRRAIKATTDVYPVTADWLKSLKERLKGE